MASNEELIEMLKTAYSMELETVMNYLANSINLDGVRAEEIKKSLSADITEEFGHATQLGHRIKQLGGMVPGSLAVKLGNQAQPTANTTDVTGVIKAVIAAEEAACAQYKKIIRATEGEDYVTQDLCITLLGAEEEHLILFKGFLEGIHAAVISVSRVKGTGSGVDVENLLTHGQNAPATSTPDPFALQHPGRQPLCRYVSRSTIEFLVKAKVQSRAQALNRLLRT